MADDHGEPNPGPLGEPDPWWHVVLIIGIGVLICAAILGL